MTYNEKKSLYESIMKDVAKSVKCRLNEAEVDSFKDKDIITKEDAKDILNRLYNNWDDIDEEKKARIVKYIKTLNIADKVKEIFNNATWMNKLMKIYERAINEKNKEAEITRKKERLSIENNTKYNYDAANIFYLTDSSGSMSDQAIHEIFYKIITLEFRTHGLKSAMTYFSTGIDASRIRTWGVNDSRLDILKKLRYDSSKDISGGTDIYKSIAQVTKLDSKYFSKNHPNTIIIVITDGEDGTDFINKLPSSFMNRIAFMIVNDKDSLSRIVSEYQNAGVSDKNILAVDINMGNTTN